MTKRKKVVIAVAAGTVFASAASAQFFGVPMITFDITQASNAVAQISKMAQEYALLTQTYQTTVNAYETAKRNAEMIAGKSGWSYLSTPLLYPTSANTMGTSGGWMSTINSGLATTRNYEAATVRMSSPYGLYSSLSTAGQNRMAAHVATVELNDGVAQNAMAVTGASRAAAQAQANALASLKSDSLSNDPAQNTQNGLLNKVNSATLISAQAQQETNKLLAAAVDQQTIEAKIRHDALVGEINNSVAAQAASEQNKQTLWGGHSSTFSTRLP